MPILSGLKVGRKIVQDQLTSSIVFLFTYSNVQDTDKAKRLGALGHLARPLDEKPLISMIEMSVERDRQT